MQSLPNLFRELLPESFLDTTQHESGVKLNNSLYSPLVIMWLLAEQRLKGGASLESAVFELLRGLPASFWPNPCKRVRDWQENVKAPSSYTGAYNQARQALPMSIVQPSCDRIFEQLLSKIDPNASHNAPGAFVLDGSTMRAAHSEALCQQYPPGSNQHGEGHWPLIRVLVAHELRTGLAMRPEWGAVHGADAVSEQALLTQMADRLPDGATVIADANFGVFSVVHILTEHGHPIVLRLTAARARRLAGEPLRDGIDRELVWEPSRHDRMNNPDLPADASVRGRLIVRELQLHHGAPPVLLSLFTTLPSTQDPIATYGERWNIETDLRTLKTALRLDQLTCTTPDMVAKEIEIAMAAYNLVRATIAMAAQQSDTPPRGYSFTKVQLVVQTFGPKLAAAPDDKAARLIFDQMRRYLQQSKLPRRTRKRPSYPRQVWGSGAKFPSRKI